MLSSARASASRTVWSVMLLVVVSSLLCVSAALATTYYVDSVGGNDNNNGTSQSSAWQTLTKVNATTFGAGDQILFKCGCAWSGQLHPQGSGASGSPIVINTYGTGAKPIIAGGGAAQEALLLSNQQYWEVNNLEITNWAAAGPGLRQGVRILGTEVGQLNHIYLKTLNVHDVNGSITTGRNGGKCNAGILLDVEGTTTRTWFNDVLIEGCFVHYCDRGGIKTWTNWEGYGCKVRSPHTNVIVRNNTLDDIGGDGICLGMADGALVEYNVASNCNARANTYNVAIWAWDMDDSVFQYNEAYLTHTTSDGQGFDIDGITRRTIMQYNYSHDNDGGFMMVCEENGSDPCLHNDGSVVRYNISQNDHNRTYVIGGAVTNATIYNNTIYTPADITRPIFENRSGVSPTNIYWYNNIFYVRSTGTYDMGGGTNYCDYNLFYPNHPRNEPSDAHKLTSDPLLVSPGSGGTGRTTVDGYKLQSGSPCRNAGTLVANNGGKDYWGNPVPAGSATDRGAYEYPETVLPPVANFSGNPTSGPAPLTVAFTDLSTNNPTSWSWTFGDGGTSSAQSPSHTYNSTGSYTVSLTATNSAGSDGETKTNYISVVQPVDYFCASLTVNTGTLKSGDHTSVHASDDAYLVIGSAKVGNKQTAQVSYTFTTGLGSLSFLSATVEGKVSAGTQPQTVYAYNYTTSAWDTINSSTLTTSDTTVNPTVSNPANYLSGGTVQVRVKAGGSGSTVFDHSTDLVKITAAP